MIEGKDCSWLALIVLLTAGAAGCGASEGDAFKPKSGFEPPRHPDGSIDDRSMCEWRGRADREISETAGPGSILPNVRRVWQVIGTGADRQKVLVCREIDTNFDGVKDVVRRYNDSGESLHEEADANYDGRIDTWITFAKGRLAEVKLDGDGDGNPDEWKYYSDGRLSRVKRDTTKNGKADTWEFYRKGRLERMGVDLDGDERVDRWDHDTEARREREAEEDKEDAETEQGGSGGDDEGTDEAESGAPPADDGAASASGAADGGTQ